jgi:hypothetical protein
VGGELVVLDSETVQDAYPGKAVVGRYFKKMQR